MWGQAFQLQPLHSLASSKIESGQHWLVAFKPPNKCLCEGPVQPLLRTSQGSAVWAYWSGLHLSMFKISHSGQNGLHLILPMNALMKVLSSLGQPMCCCLRSLSGWAELPEGDQSKFLVGTNTSSLIFLFFDAIRTTIYCTSFGWVSRKISHWRNCTMKINKMELVSNPTKYTLLR